METLVPKTNWQHHFWIGGRLIVIILNKTISQQKSNVVLAKPFVKRNAAIHLTPFLEYYLTYTSWR